MAIRRYQPKEEYEAENETLTIAIKGPNGKGKILLKKRVKFIEFKRNFIPGSSDSITIIPECGRITFELSPEINSNLRKYIEDNRSDL